MCMDPENIPSIGGRETEDSLRDFVTRIPDGSAVVEVGGWLGAGTRPMAEALDSRGTTHRMDLFDRFTTTGTEVTKAAKAGVNLKEGQNTIPVVLEYLKGIRQPITFHRGELLLINWDGGKIGLYVDDAAKSELHFRHMLHSFGPSWIPGETIIVLMDYFFWRQREADGRKDPYKFQYNFVTSHPDSFAPVEGWEELPMVAAAFRYTAPLDFSAIAPPNYPLKYRMQRLFRRLEVEHHDPGGA